MSNTQAKCVATGLGVLVGAAREPGIDQFERLVALDALYALDQLRVTVMRFVCQLRPQTGRKPSVHSDLLVATQRGRRSVCSWPSSLATPGNSDTFLSVSTSLMNAAFFSP